MANGSKQVREKAIKAIADLLFNGKERAEILQTITKNYKASDGTIDKWIKKARPIVLERQQQAEEIRARVFNEEISEAVKNGLKSNLEIEQRLLQIGWAEIEVEEITTSEQFGVTKFKRKPTPAEQRAALDTVLKIRGGFAPSKVAQTDSNGNDIEILDLSKLDEKTLKQILNVATAKSKG